MLIAQMENQGGNRQTLLKQTSKAYENHQLVFQKCDLSSKNTLKTL